MKKTKIIATFGPAIAGKTKILKLVKAGANLFRINCSHGGEEDFLKAARLIRDATRSCPFPVGILFDISGPKLRLALFKGMLPVKKRGKVTLTHGNTDLSKACIGVNYPEIIEGMKAGERIYIDDGNLIFRVLQKKSGSALIEAQNHGVLLPGKGINLPDSNVAIPTLTAKDKSDVKTAIRAGADFIALSFVRSGEDIIELRKLLKRGKGAQKVVAKLEKREAIEALEEIMRLSDGVMVARGDLGVELNQEELPTLQRRIIKMANELHKSVIVATQMLESMRFSPRPTRAEVNDVASAVFDFADAVMLSAETATGKYPVESVAMMSRVIEATEQAATPPPIGIHKEGICSPIPLSIAEAVRNARAICNARLIFAFTTSGFTAEMISNLFPKEPIIALTSDKLVMRQLTLPRSVYSIEVKQPRSLAELFGIVNLTCARHRLARRGDRVIVTGGAPFGKMMLTNFMMVHEI
ncbi:MAG: pyruvate kinase [Planctomycetota bacterium]